MNGMNELGKLQRKIFAKEIVSNFDLKKIVYPFGIIQKHPSGKPETEETTETPDFIESSLAANSSLPWALPYLFEGDIILTPDQMNSAIAYAKQQLAEMEGQKVEDRSKRTLTSNTRTWWNTLPIPFTVSRGGQ